MAFGSPRPSVTVANIASVATGGLLMHLHKGVIWWFGFVLLLLGFWFGLILGSWFQLIPGSKPVGKQGESESTP